MAASQTEILIKVIDALEELESPYFVGGSYASSAYGIARATMDIDIVAAIPAKNANALALKLQTEFYADEQAIRDAIMSGRSFNVIHLETMFKVDIFVAGREPYDLKQLERRRPEVIAVNPDRAVYLSSPEDTILTKLRWYRQTGQQSERQWSDVLGVLSVQEGELDLDYLRQWAGKLRISDLFERALAVSRAD